MHDQGWNNAETPSIEFFFELQELEQSKCNAIHYPLVMTDIAIENDPFIVDFPIKNGDVPQLC